MCGIVGYVGQRPATSLLTEGLERSEYRGYHSAGVVLRFAYPRALLRGCDMDQPRNLAKSVTVE